MGFTASVNRWKAKFGKADSVPSYSTAGFPLETALIDPVIDRIHELRHRETECALLLIRIENFSLLAYTYEVHVMEQLNIQIKEAIEDIITETVQEDMLYGMKQFGSEDFGIFLKETSQNAFAYLNNLGDDVCRRLLTVIEELRLQPTTSGSLTFIHSHTVLERSVENTHFAVQNAYFYARTQFNGRMTTAVHPYKEDIISILNEENITVLAQPIMNLRNGDVFGWEILTRGPRNTPFYGPTELFDFAFQSDLLIRMECLVIRKALLEIATRRIQEQVFINVTSVSLAQPIFLEFLLNELKEFPDVASTQLIFEITERHAIRDYHEMGLTISKYRSHGFRFAVDDAGAGYSSLLTISELIPDIIKIDKSLIQNIDQISVKRSMLKALMAFAQDIRCEVVAEGIEREEEAEVLFQHEVQMGQGYYFARPEPLNGATPLERTNQLENFQSMKVKIKQLREAAQE
ncbi:EAL domain-containing protein [Paenibacillus swuensis]|uniref:EAL domain-containing protein n=1 Tax=Paenibacillus swuensis TaxID=1178515 RepID=UPI0008399B17|nr:EAL domain-containing protein [Paenibacillus swuensis]